MKFRVIAYVLIIAISAAITYNASQFFSSQMVSLPNDYQYQSMEFYPARISKIHEDVDVDDPFSVFVKMVSFNAIITSGPFSNTEIRISQGYDERMLLELYPLNENDRVILYRSLQGDYVVYQLVSFQRTNQLLLLITLFSVSLILFARMQGLNALISLGFTLYIIFNVLIPAVLSNYNLYLVTVLSAFFITALSFYLISGLSRKTHAAIIGSFGGILASTVIAIVFIQAMRMSGILGEDYSFLVYIRNDLPIDLKGVLFMGIIIGSIGAIMDVAMSIASSLEEIVINAPDISALRLIQSGMTIGKDIMGTMANTLILAYVGGSLSTVILFFVYNRPGNLLLNSEYAAAEVLQAIAGSMGLIFVIPITAVASAVLLKQRQRLVTHKDN
jgi:uncharacterized membrane protein